MSVVTLETLRADFEAARAVYEAHYAQIDHQLWDIYDILDWVDVDSALRDAEVVFSSCHKNVLEPKGIAVYQKATLYVLARDHGLQAAMLWKLQNCGAL